MNINTNYNKTQIILDNYMSLGTNIFPDLLSAFCIAPIYINKGGTQLPEVIQDRGKAFYNTMELLHAIHDLETKGGDPYAIRLKITFTDGTIYHTEYEAWDPYVKFSHDTHWFTLLDYLKDDNGDISPVELQWPLDTVDFIQLECHGFTPPL